MDAAVHKLFPGYETTVHNRFHIFPDTQTFFPTLYYIAIGAITKEQLEVSVKCNGPIQSDRRPFIFSQMLQRCPWNYHIYIKSIIFCGETELLALV